MTRRGLLAGVLGLALPALAQGDKKKKKDDRPKEPAAPKKPARPRKLTRPLVTLETSKGTILLELYPEEAPLAVQNFMDLIRKRFYDGLAFHRIEDFVAQGGDPRGDGTGGPGYTIKSEVNSRLQHARGALGMANSGRDTGGSQFYIVKKDSFGLDNGSYTLFGKVTGGLDVVDKLVKGDKMVSVTVEAPQMGPTQLAQPDNLALPLLPDDYSKRPANPGVRVKVQIGAAGGAGVVTLAKGCGDKELDAAVLDAIAAWRWTPALKKGEPVASTQEFTYDLATFSRRYE